MILLIGLGNPGKEYEQTPHNMGRDAVLRFAAGAGLPEPVFEKKFNALISRGAVGSADVFVALPETFMNLSGEAVAAIANFYKISPQNIWIAHDDIDIPLGNVRVSLGGGSAGHHGVESVVEKLGTENFWRFRIGIAPEAPLAIPLDAYVLQRGAIADSVRNTALEKAAWLLAAAFEKSVTGAEKASD